MATGFLTTAPETDETFITAAEKVYQILLKKITTGEFAPGTRLPRRKLAEMTGVSQIPVLEAMKKLEQDGLVEYKQRWGSIVAVPTLQRVKDMYALREAIECQVIRILTKKIADTQVEELKTLARELDETPYSDATAQYISDVHYKFHMRMADFTGHDTLVAVLRRANLFWLLWRGVISRRSKAETRKNWHGSLIDTILAKDLGKADRAMREHIRDAYIPLLNDMGDSAEEAE
jgi:DNA-binding GntR family transcriptional regulator